MNRTRTLLLGAAGLTTLALALACGGGSSTVSAPPTGGNVGFMTTDATSETWSSVGVIIRKAYLVPQGDTTGAGKVQIYDGTNDLTFVDLLQEDQIQDLLGQVAGVPAGTYDHLLVEVDGSTSAINLVPAPVGGVVQAAVPPGQITVRGAAAADTPAGQTWIQLPSIPLTSPVVVGNGTTSAVAVDFDLAHPAFIVAHDVTIGTQSETIYAVNFSARGAFRQKAAASLDKFYLRRHRGTVTSIAPDNKSFTMLTEHGQTLTILADPNAASPTLFYDLDTPPAVAVPGNTVPATVLGTGAGAEAVECTARFQADNTLTAVRVWSIAAANAARLPSYRPEGHVAKVDATGGVIYVLNAAGAAMPIAVDTGTQWFFHGDTSTDISAGAGAPFLNNIGRYFKLSLTVDPTTTPNPTAKTINIQRGVFEGLISAPSATGFTYTKTWADATQSVHSLSYDSTFSFWNFTFPGSASTNIASGTPNFVNEASGTITLGATTFTPYASSSLDWVSGAWQADNAIFLPIALSARVQTVVSYDATSGDLVVTPFGSATNVTVTLDNSATSQEQPLVTTFTKQGGVVTIAPQTVGNWATVLTTGARIRAYGVPDGSGNLKGYYVNIYN